MKIDAIQASEAVARLRPSVDINHLSTFTETNSCIEPFAVALTSFGTVHLEAPKPEPIELPDVFDIIISPASEASPAGIAAGSEVPAPEPLKRLSSLVPSTTPVTTRTRPELGTPHTLNPHTDKGQQYMSPIRTTDDAVTFKKTGAAAKKAGYPLSRSAVKKTAKKITGAAASHIDLSPTNDENDPSSIATPDRYANTELPSMSMDSWVSGGQDVTPKIFVKGALLSPMCTCVRSMY